MMSRAAASIFFLLSFPFFAEAAQKLIDCRSIVGGMRECIPYSSKLLKAKEITYEQSQKKLIVDKTLPLPPRKNHLKVIPIEEMIERYVKVEEPKRFQGTEESSKAFVLPVKKRKEKEPRSEGQISAKETNTTAYSSVEHNASIEMTRPKSSQTVETQAPQYGIYKVRKGDSLGKIAVMFGLKNSKELMKFNDLQGTQTIRIGQKLKIPMPQDKIDAIASASYKVKEGDTLISIANQFGLDPKALAGYNKIRNTAQLGVGKVLKLPLPYVLAAEKVKKKREAQRRAKNKWNQKKQTYSSKLIRGFGKHKLRVTATAYTSHRGQTDKTPFVAAWNNRLRPGMKVIAVSRDLLYKYGMRNGTRVKISGLPGVYRVRDKMNKRYRRRIDIYMGTDRRRALRWGRRSVVIYW